MRETSRETSVPAHGRVRRSVFGSTPNRGRGSTGRPPARGSAGEGAESASGSRYEAQPGLRCGRRGVWDWRRPPAGSAKHSETKGRRTNADGPEPKAAAVRVE